MGTYLKMLKTTNVNPSERWIVKYYDKPGRRHVIREVKQVYDAADYRKNGRARDLYTKEQLVTLLEKNKSNV
jgi:hypothetical protein